MFTENVQHLFELKYLLEISVEILKGEVWALNSEIKRRFAKQNSLKINFEQVNDLVTKLQIENKKLNKKLRLKEKELIWLKKQLEYCDTNGKLLKNKNKIFCDSLECSAKLAILSLNLTIKTRDNDALIRENNELIMTRVSNYMEIHIFFLKW
uniref:Uncharacterized protein n=1 Tax=Meloidogyne hapla TaxID=6305 RepID=A0A1I8BVE7_MELHA